MNQNILKININAFQKSSQSSQSSPLNTDTYYYSYNIEIESSVDFILSHFEEPIFPRKISTYKSQQNRPFQFTVSSIQEIIDSFRESFFVDCQINAYPFLTDFKEVPRYKPEFLFIDIDRSSFEDDKSFDRALSKTLTNIKNKLNGEPTVLFTVGGYHIYQPVYCPTALENIKEFNGFDKPSEQLLRFAKDCLSNSKADKNNNPSFRSCLLRIPGSYRSKYNTKVKIVKKWNGVRAPITIDFLEEFRTWLIQKKIDQQKQRQKNLEFRNNSSCNNFNIKSYDWIETKILPNPFSDYRKLAVGLILAPYLVVIKKLSYEESYKIINEWLMKCDSVRKLDFNPKYLINNSIKTSIKKLIPPISIYKLETNYPNMYFLIDQKKRK
jgi:hypothetical protein